MRLRFVVAAQNALVTTIAMVILYVFPVMAAYVAAYTAAYAGFLHVPFAAMIAIVLITFIGVLKTWIYVIERLYHLLYQLRIKNLRVV